MGFGGAVGGAGEVFFLEGGVEFELAELAALFVAGDAYGVCPSDGGLVAEPGVAVAFCLMEGVGLVAEGVELVD